MLIQLIENIESGGGGGETHDLTDVVNTTTDQTINGLKTFTTTPQVRFGGARLPEEYQ